MTREALIDQYTFRLWDGIQASLGCQGAPPTHAVIRFNLNAFADAILAESRDGDRQTRDLIKLLPKTKRKP